MRITWNELTVGFDPEQADALLSDWRWLTGNDVKLLVVSALGDLFLQAAEGQLLWLDTGAANLTCIAESAAEFQQLMQQTEHANEWFAPQLIGDLITHGKHLEPGQCYSYKLPPMLGGKFKLSNFEATDLLVHCSIHGQLGRQIQNLPEGTKIDRIEIVDDDG